MIVIVYEDVVDVTSTKLFYDMILLLSLIIKMYMTGKIHTYEIWFNAKYLTARWLQRAFVLVHNNCWITNLPCVYITTMLFSFSSAVYY